MFPTHKKESHHKFHCTRRHKINHCSSLFYGKTCKCSIPKTLYTWHACDLILEKIYSKNKPQTNNLIALSHSLPVKHQEICHLCHLHHQNQGQEKVHETYPRGKSSQVNLFPTFDSDKTIPREATMNETTVLQLSAVFFNWHLLHERLNSR